ncbi:hypothetical protein [Bacillus taeanensis]|uniref:Uncharacterized protein n=1 Tax=Bacillus taeanensis TaxID=273032 RepID=A0A366XRM8_9BACI|nr:hypothetical protein [Bacillus taeanensis]RBW69010.1 hypothetical protein DS031_13815 [Bacillus taeanensis]
MKVVVVFLFMLLLAILFNISMDMLLKIKMSESLENLRNPFWVMETGEYVILTFIIVITIMQQVMPIIKKKIKAKKRGSI